MSKQEQMARLEATLDKKLKTNQLKNSPDELSQLRAEVDQLRHLKSALENQQVKLKSNRLHAKTFKFSAETIELILSLAYQYRCDQTTVIEKALLTLKAQNPA